MVSTLLLATITYCIKRGGDNALFDLKQTGEIVLIWALCLCLYHLVRSPWLIHTGRTFGPRNLQARISEMSRELFSFLREKGPEPTTPTNNLKTLDDTWRQISRVWFAYAESIHYGYNRRFRDRLIELCNDMDEASIRYDLSLSDINPKASSVDPEKVKRIARELGLVAAKLTIEDQSKGT